MLSFQIEAEIALLTARYGTPIRTTADLTGTWFHPLIKPDRSGEVCMVVRRKNGKLITAIKTFYPPGAFRLLTGGIDHGESIEAALLRETYEETGLTVAVRRFLAVVEYRQATAHAPAREGGPTNTVAPAPITFATFAFLLEEISGTLGSLDPQEQLGEFREVAVEELPAMAVILEHVGDEYNEEIQGAWRDWGEFRAVTHRVVYDALTMHSREGATPPAKGDDSYATSIANPPA